MKIVSLSSIGGTVVVALFVMMAASSDAFSPLAMKGKAMIHQGTLTMNPTTLVTPFTTGRLFMEEGDGEGGDESPTIEGDSEVDVPATTSSSSSDDSLAMMKKEIEQLEQELKAKKSSLMYAQDQIEEYSKAGYARAVAEMENMRRVRLVRFLWVMGTLLLWS
jgi:hypothetical protein